MKIPANRGAARRERSRHVSQCSTGGNVGPPRERVEHKPPRGRPARPLDHDTAERFLAARDPGATRHRFQTFDDNSDRKGRCGCTAIIGTDRTWAFTRTPLSPDWL